MQAEKVQTCYICKIKFVCPCWEEKVQLKERCCALGKVEYRVECQKMHWPVHKLECGKK